MLATTAAPIVLIFDAGEAQHAIDLEKKRDGKGSEKAKGEQALAKLFYRSGWTEVSL